VEAVVVAGVGGWAVSTRPNLLWMPVVCTLAALMVSWPYTLFRAKNILGSDLLTLAAAWYRPLVFVAIPGFAAAALLAKALASLPALIVLAAGGAILSLVVLASLCLQSSFRDPLVELWSKRHLPTQPVE
jgi:hypothetical protein